jgi:transposase
VDRGRSGRAHEADTQAEDRSPGCAAIAEAPDGRSLSEDLDTRRRKSGYAQLLWHRHRLVQMRTRIMNQLHVVAINEGVRRKKALWRPAGRNELESLVLAPWASRRREDLLNLLDQLTEVHELTRVLEEEVEKRPVARRLMTHPGVGPLTALAFELVIGTPERFPCAKQIASYVGLVPAEESSGDRRRLGHISKQGNSLLRFLLVEAAQVHGAQLPTMAQQILPPGRTRRIG